MPRASRRPAPTRDSWSSEHNHHNARHQQRFVRVATAITSFASCEDVGCHVQPQIRLLSSHSYMICLPLPLGRLSHITASPWRFPNPSGPMNPLVCPPRRSDQFPHPAAPSQTHRGQRSALTPMTPHATVPRPAQPERHDVASKCPTHSDHRRGGEPPVIDEGSQLRVSCCA